MKKYEAKITEVATIGLVGVGFNDGYDDNIKVYTFHRHYQIGNKHSYSSLQECIDDNKKDNHIFKLYLYDYSGLAFSLAPFADKGHSGLLGYICIGKNISSLEATKMACEMVQEANDIERGAFVEVRIKELDLCDCCNNTKSWDYIDGLVFNIYNEDGKKTVVDFVSYYIKDFDTKALDTLIDNRYN